MPQTPEELANQLRLLTEAGARGQLVAKGLARGMIWRNGILPTEAPLFGDALSADLLDHGYAMLALALRLKDSQGDKNIVTDGCRIAAEAIEAAVRRGERNEERGYHLTTAAVAFHIAGYAARSFCLLTDDLQQLNLSSFERVTISLIQRKLPELRQLCFAWLQNTANTDDGIIQRLETDAEFSEEEVISLALSKNFHRAIALFDAAMQTGVKSSFEEAVVLLKNGTAAASEAHVVPLWWVHILARHLIEELWNQSFHARLPLLPENEDGILWNKLRYQFIALLSARKLSEIDLWPSQLIAAQRAINVEDDLAVAMPTSAGKTRIAELCILRTLAAGKRVVYVTPLRALSAQLERKLSSTFAPLGFSISSLYGASGVTVADVDALDSTQIVVATPEKLDFAIRQKSSVIDDVGLIVLDEGHMIGLGPREVRYEVLVQRLLARPDANTRRIVCLSAVFSSGDAFEDFTKWLRSDVPGEAVETKWRPTRQRAGVLRWMGHAGRLDLIVEGERPFVPRFVEEEAPQGRRRKSFPAENGELVIAAAKTLVTDGQRVLLYCPERRSVEGLANKCLKLNRQGYFPSYLEDETLIARAVKIGEEWLGADHVAVRALHIGVAVHHGGLPRQFLSEIEALLSRKLLPVAIASPTLAQGLDLSCSAIIFNSIYRGGKMIRPEEYANVVGRAGRAFVDLDGLSIYPIFDTNRRINDYEQLLREAVNRQLESGILLLIREVVGHLANALQYDQSQLLDHVLNFEGPWMPDVINVEARTDLQKLLGDLDAAILSTVEDLDCTIEVLADVLDTALRSSYWKRRINHLSEDEQLLQETILRGRARWLWNHSTGAQRKGFFAAGVGHEAGSFIDANLDTLLGHLCLADSYIAEGQSQAAFELITLAENLFSIYLFTPDHLPSRWRELLAGWLSGQPLSEVVSADDPHEVDFIQQGIVYLLVWAIEAVRVHAVSQGRSEAELITGATALALTYGAPSLPCALLMQAGLPSRAMALSLLEAFPADFNDMEGLGPWLSTVINEINSQIFWPEPETRSIWQKFVTEWQERANRKWTSTDSILEVTWSHDPPSAGEIVRLIDDPIRGITHVCTSDLMVVGQLQNRFLGAISGNISAKIDADLRIICHRFGPA